MVTVAEGLGVRDKEREHQWHNQQNKPSGLRSGSTFRRLSPTPFGGQVPVPKELLGAPAGV